MRTIYIDSENKCHTVNDGTMTAVETDFFDGKCDTFVEGYCYVIKENGYAIFPWQSYCELDAAQRKYELALIADMRQALETLGVTVDA